MNPSKLELIQMSDVFDEILKSGRHCPECDMFVDNDQETCPACGHEFEEDEDDE